MTLERQDSVSSNGSSSSSLKSSRKQKKKKANQKESGDILTEEELKDVDTLLRMDTVNGRNFNTNILRIALNMKEQQVASILLSQYCTNLDEDIISHALKHTKLDFIHNMFMFNKNYQTIFPKKLDAFEMAILNDKQKEEALAVFAKGPTYRVFT